MSRSTWHRFSSHFGSLLIVACCCTPLLHAAGPASVTYTYDDLGRLRTGEISDGSKIDYQYDPAGNRTSMTSGLPPLLTIGAAASVAEGASLSFPVTMTRVNPAPANITVSCAPQNGTAQGGGSAPFDDFVTTAPTVTFLTSDPSGTVKNCVIATKTDSYYEGTQTMSAVLQNATGGGVISSPSSANGSILDANAGPVFSVAGASGTEGSAVGFTITKAGLTELSHNVSYATANGTATTGDSDYTAIGTTAVTFTSGQTSSPVSVATTSDGKYEGAETVALNLSSATNGATIGTSSANGTINNDDAAPSIVITSSGPANEGAVATLAVSNVGNTNTAFSHSISWSTANNTATSGTDYTASSGTVTLTSGETGENIQVQTLTDGVYEGSASETFFVNISTNGSSNGAVITGSQATATITEMDNVAPSVPLWVSPNFRQDNDGNFSVIWNPSTGPVSYYVLEETHNTTNFASATPYTVPVPDTAKSFNGKFNGTWRYRVKACNSGGLCSAVSTVIRVEVCIGGCN